MSLAEVLYDGTKEVLTGYVKDLCIRPRTIFALLTFSLMCTSKVNSAYQSLVVSDKDTSLQLTMQKP